MISISDAPKGGDTALSDAVSHLLYSGPLALSPRGGFGPDTPSPQGLAQAAKPLQVFSIDLNRIQNTDFLNDAAPNGWRYIIYSAGPVAVADVRSDDKGGAVFSRLIRGPIALKLSEAADIAERLYGDRPEYYQARILEIPSLYKMALWLHGPEEVFFPILLNEHKRLEGEDSKFLDETVLQASGLKSSLPLKR